MKSFDYVTYKFHDTSGRLTRVFFVELMLRYIRVEATSGGSFMKVSFTFGKIDMIESWSQQV